ncbi:peptidase M14 [Dokdonia sinensis]|uniref:Peptidase M14 n=1 Tax=Dokdonia sinensis TaxID=2479847 RepID=A0A3M0G5M3_9FLAO|nr:M14 family zinc carboxypeptidase [Dokdonia sinensis]RMB57562.1 peptidase M14 [Dokdonia sinensis]
MNLQLENLLDWHKSNHQKVIKGRYINLHQIEPLIDDLSSSFKISVLGHSVEERPIYAIEFGQGKIKILMWSQMHGNESTTTKAVFDLFKAVDDADKNFDWVSEHFTIIIIPMLNPDGAQAYTRVNAAQVDLNRDAQDLTQPESQVLAKIFEDFKPDYCFNLHGQRTIYGFEASGALSVLSFLAPSGDEGRSVTLSRKRAMNIISHIYNGLNPQLSGKIGRYDDDFNLNCTGDTFMAAGIPTILFEAGHYPDDYEREVTRGYVFAAISIALAGIALKKEDVDGDYFKIPEHQKCFFDIILRNSSGDDIAVQYEEVLQGNKVLFVPKVSQIGDLDRFFGHKEIAISSAGLYDEEDKKIEVGDTLTEWNNSIDLTITL